MSESIVGVWPKFRQNLITEHWLFHGRAPVSLLRDRACETLFAVYVTTDDQLWTV